MDKKESMNNEEISRLIQETLRIYTASVAERNQWTKEATRSAGNNNRSSSSTSNSISSSNSSYPYGRINDLSDRVIGLASLTSLKQVLEQIPTAEKRSFIEACRVCPDLVRQESDPVAFLRRENYNIWAGARRLVKYWEYRHDTFGDEKAFLPLNLTGHGALSDEDIAALLTGFQSILPPDGMGRPVLLLDFSKVPQGCNVKVLERTFFFLRCVASQSDVGQEYGYVGLVVYNDAFRSIRGILQRAVRAVNNVMPISPTSIYVIRIEKQTFFQMLRSLDPVAGGIWKNLTLVMGETPAEICSKMQKHHLSAAGLPETFGGTFSENACREWINVYASLDPAESYTKVGLYPFDRNPLLLQTRLTGLTNMSIDEAVMDVYEEIDHMLDLEKGAYLEAMEICPDLVNRESCPKQFLRCEANDPSAVARRLTQYWTMRKDLFQERAFRPMDTTGKGVFTKEEVERLDRGFMRILPPDAQGRPVIWWDRSCMTAIKSFEEALRWWFYIFSVVAEDAVVQEKGICFVAVYKPEVYKTPIRQSSKATITQMVTKAIPIATYETHVIALRKPGQTLDPELFSMFIERLGRNVITDIAESPEEIASKLMGAGLTRAGIPDTWGGTRSWRADVIWRTQRDLLENGRYLTPARDPGSMDRIIQARGLAGQTSIPSGSGAEQLVIKSIHALSAGDIVEYVDAARVDPDLVARETDLARYLIADMGNASASANRVVKYWKTKKELCGASFITRLGASRQSAIPPMLTPCLCDGSMVRLVGADPAGQDALYVEDTCTEGKDWCSGLFYALFTISNSTKSMNATTFSVFVRATKPVLYTAFVKKLVDYAETVFPLRLAQIHMLFQEKAPESGHGLVHQGWVLDLENEIGHGLSDRILFHFAGFEDDTRESLVRLGFSREALITVMGTNREKASCGKFGLWTGQDFEIEGQKKARPVSSPLSSGRIHEQSSLASLEEAILLLPEEEKAAYIRARKEAPSIVESESNPMLFLKHEKWNAWKAAKRLTCYWKTRCQLFKDREFLPLNQTGEGALTKKEVAHLSTGCAAFLPPDNEGRAVICVDGSRVVKSDPAACMRIMFYWNHVVLGNELSVEKGVVLLIVLDKVSLDHRIQELVVLATSCFPFCAHSVHIVPKVKKRAFLDKWVPTILGLFVRTSSNNKHLHLCDKKEMLKRLQIHGLKADGIPETVGGTWSYDKFSIWQEQRIRIEWDLPLGTLDESFSGATASAARPMSELTEEERVERKRRYNILHSRRKRRRDRVEIEVLQKQVSELRKEYEELACENQRLQALFERASQVAQAQARSTSSNMFFGGRVQLLVQENDLHAAGNLQMFPANNDRSEPVCPFSEAPSIFLGRLALTNNTSLLQNSPPQMANNHPLADPVTGPWANGQQTGSGIPWNLLFPFSSN